MNPTGATYICIHTGAEAFKVRNGRQSESFLPECPLNFCMENLLFSQGCTLTR